MKAAVIVRPCSRAQESALKQLWLAFAAVIVCSFAVLGWTGFPDLSGGAAGAGRVVTAEGREVIGPDEIYSGQNVWQSMGAWRWGLCGAMEAMWPQIGQADWLHREVMFILDRWSGTSGEVRRTAAGAPGRTTEPAATAHAGEYLRPAIPGPDDRSPASRRV